MSQENVELIKRAFAALNRRDVDAAKAIADPNCELRTRFTGLEGRPYLGHQGVEDWFADVRESWATVKQTPERFIQVDDRRIIVATRFEGRGKGSGVEVDQLIGGIWTIQDERVISIETHKSVDDALEAVGLSE